MGEWNFDMSAAPRGQTELRTRKGRDGSDIEYTRHVSPKIIAAAADGETVTVSHWIPDAERWNMFAKEHPPIAWMPWPAHPGAA
jgi:hypothetical protein